MSGTAAANQAGASYNRLEFRDLANHCQGTYEALSYVVEVIILSGRPSLQHVAEPEMDQILLLLENYQVDLSSLSQFPLDAPDVDEALLLLARLQNRAALGNAEQQKAKAFVPTIRDITEFTLLDRSKKTYRYNIGEWLEVRGNSMRYRMEIIHNILKQKNADGEDEYIFETTVDPKLTIDELRWPREALRRIFGMGPWVWQQWAMLKLEDKLVFRQGHAHDFELLDIRGYAEELWALWLHDKRNQSFRTLWDRVGASGQAELAKHIFSPFDLMVEVIHDQDQWEFADAGVSIFTYLSLLGSGFFDGAIVVFLQVFIPIILFFYYTSDREIDEIATGTREMLFAVLVYYLYKVARDTASDFHEVTGLASSTLSRIQSLRVILWENGNDSVYQSLGYTCDLFMNTGYICYLYMFNVWILFNVSDPFELLGSVIFFEFLFDLDEEIAGSRWWDTRSKRYLKAGVVGTILQNSIRGERCQSTDAYLSKFTALYSDSERELVKKRMEDRVLVNNSAANAGNDACCTCCGWDIFSWLCCGWGSEGGAGGCCCCRKAKPTFLKKQADEESELLTVTERVERIRRRESNAFQINRKPKPVRFSGAFAQIRGLYSRECPIFERHRDLRAWSQWEELIFIFPTPSLVPSGYRQGSKLVMPGSTGDGFAIRTDRGYTPGTTRRRRFFRHMWEVLTGRYGWNSFQSDSQHESFSFYFTRTLHWFVAWQSYLLQIVFPFVIVVGILLIYAENGYCSLRRGECSLPTYYGIPQLNTNSTVG